MCWRTWPPAICSSTRTVLEPAGIWYSPALRLRKLPRARARMMKPTRLRITPASSRISATSMTPLWAGSSTTRAEARSGAGTLRIHQPSRSRARRATTTTKPTAARQVGPGRPGPTPHVGSDRGRSIMVSLHSGRTGILSQTGGVGKGGGPGSCWYNDRPGATRPRIPRRETHAGAGASSPSRMARPGARLREDRDRALRAWVRPDGGQCLSPGAAVLHHGGRAHLGQDRGGAARVLAPGRDARGHPRHHPEPAQARVHAARQPPQAAPPEGPGGPRR